MRLKINALILFFFFLSLLTAQTQIQPEPGLLPNYLPCPECKENGNVYYVAIGDQNGNGSFGNPFNNIQSALDIVQPSDVVYIMPGTYYIDTRLRLNRPGTENNRICIRAYDLNDRPVLKRTGDINGNGIYDYGLKYDIGGKQYFEYGGEILLMRSPYYVVDGIIFDGNFALSGYYYKYVMGKNIPNEKAYTNVVVVPHYGGIPSTGTDYPMQIYLNQNGDHSIIRNSKIGNNLYDGLSIYADSVIVENTEIHHNLRGTFTNPVDAHGITASHVDYLWIRHCDIHQNSGDCLQVDHDVENTSHSKLWNNVFVEDTKLWTAELDRNCGGFKTGENPGENGIDTKTFEHEPLAFRPQIHLKNVAAFGFSQNGFISRRCPFNIKYQVDWFIDGVTVYNNQLGFRIRGPYNNPLQGGANVTIQNAVAFNNGLVFRFERYAENVHILNSTFAFNSRFAEHADVPTDPAYDTETYLCLNNLFLGAKPSDAPDASNLSVDQSGFVSATEFNFQLNQDSPAINTGILIEEVTTDRIGNPRPIGLAYDVGAYEYVVSQPLSKITVNPSTPEVNEITSLEQNCPNPFNPTTKISFTLHENGFVSLKIYDSLGREVAHLVNELKEKGSYTVNFDGSSLSSGIYICKIICGKFTSIRRMLLMK